MAKVSLKLAHLLILVQIWKLIINLVLGTPIVGTYGAKVREAAKQYLLENPQIADEIDPIIRDTLAVGTEEIDVIGEEVTEEV